MSSNNKTDISKKSAIKFVILLGIVSLFGDMTYEAARSITGPYLSILGASALTVGFIAGFGELIGYAFRIVSGYYSNKTHRYWLVTFIGYGINLLAVPLIALAGHWWVAASLMIAERFGKSVRVPPRDAMLSHATHTTGHGWGFGLHEALDQTGALLGPLIIAAVLYFKGGYKVSFAILLIPALLALSTLVIARILYPSPRELEVNIPQMQTGGIPRIFWYYLVAIGLIAAGYADFSLIAYHFKKALIIPDIWIPVFYAIAMGVDAIAALILGKLFDKIGISILIFVSLITSLFAPFAFLGKFNLALVGVSLWGLGMGAQESVMRAGVATMIPADKRAASYGIFGTGYGIFWFLGSITMGFLYDISIPLLVIFSMLMQLASIPLFIFIRSKTR